MAEKEVSLKEVVELLKTGHTRYTSDDAGHGSVQQKLGLTFSETRELFNHPKLKGRKTKTPPLRINDDLEEETIRPRRVRVQAQVSTPIPTEQEKSEEETKLFE